MPLDDLTGVIETIQQRIRQHGASLRENEIRTRVALIDPLLQALGWDVADPVLVTPEYPVRGGRVDYALLRPDGKPAATVEAKKLGDSLESHQMQMLNYSNASGVEYAGLTDGNHWELYEVFQRGQLAERRKLDVSIADMPAHQSALQLLLLWRPNLASGQPTEANEPIVDLPQSEPASQPPLAPVAPVPVQTPPAPAQPGWVPLSSFAWSNGANPPSLMRFPDGSEHQVQRWRSLIEIPAKWLWTQGLLAHSNLPVPVPGGSRYVANTEAVHRNGQPFLAQQAIEGTPVIVEGNVGGSQAISYAKTLLQHCGVNPADVYVQTAP